MICTNKWIQKLIWKFTFLWWTNWVIQTNRGKSIWSKGFGYRLAPYWGPLTRGPLLETPTPIWGRRGRLFGYAANATASVSGGRFCRGSILGGFIYSRISISFCKKIRKKLELEKHSYVHIEVAQGFPMMYSAVIWNLKSKLSKCIGVSNFKFREYSIGQWQGSN